MVELILKRESQISITKDSPNYSPGELPDSSNRAQKYNKKCPKE